MFLEELSIGFAASSFFIIIFEQLSYLNGSKFTDRSDFIKLSIQALFCGKGCKSWMANLFIWVLCMFWIACIQPTPHAADQTCSCFLCPQTSAQGSIHWAWSNTSCKSSVLACSVSHPHRQWHIHTWLSLPLLHTLCGCFEGPILVTVGRAFWSICSFTVSVLLHLLHGTVCLSSKH